MAAVVTDEMLIRFRAEGTAAITKDVAAYEKATDKAAASTARLGKTSGKTALAAQNFGRVISDLPYGFIAISNNIEPLLFSLGASGGLTLAFTLAAAAGVIWEKSMQGHKKTTSEFKDSLDEISSALDKVNTKLITQNVEFYRAELNTVEKNLADQKALRASMEKDIKKAFEQRQVNASTEAQLWTEILATKMPSAARKGFDEVDKEIERLQKRSGELVSLISGLSGMTIGKDPLTKTETPELHKDFEMRPNAEDFENAMKRSKMLADERATLARKEVTDWLTQWDKAEKLRLDMRENAIKEATKKENILLNSLEDGFYGVAQGLEMGLTRAFERSFGEANSLLEMFILKMTQSAIFQLAGLAIGTVSGGGILGFLGGQLGLGGTAPTGRITSGGSPMQINLSIGRREMRALVADANNEIAVLRFG